MIWLSAINEKTNHVINYYARDGCVSMFRSSGDISAVCVPGTTNISGASKYLGGLKCNATALIRSEKV